MGAHVVAVGLETPEGPVVLPDGRIAFVEQRRALVSVLGAAGVDVLARVRGAANAVALGTDGLYAAQNGGVVGGWRSADPAVPGIERIGVDGSVHAVLSEVADEPCRAPNDLVFGADGRLWFTDPSHAYDPVRRGAPGRLLAVGDGLDDVALPVGPSYCNGLAFEPKGSLVWVESYERRVRRLRPDGTVEEVCQLPEGHVPDGLAVAADGRLFVTTVTSGGVTVVSPDGDVLDLLVLDGDALPTNCCFDGPVLWVTDFGRANETVRGEGRLWRLETDAVGAAVHTGSLQSRGA